MKMRLTKRSVEAIEPAESDVLVWDADLPGFGVKVTPRGARTYVLQYSRRDRTRRCTIGRHGDVQLDKAYLGQVIALMKYIVTSVNAALNRDDLTNAGFFDSSIASGFVELAYREAKQR